MEKATVSVMFVARQRKGLIVGFVPFSKVRGKRRPSV